MKIAHCKPTTLHGPRPWRRWLQGQRLRRSQPRPGEFLWGLAHQGSIAAGMPELIVNVTQVVFKTWRIRIIQSSVTFASFNSLSCWPMSVHNKTINPTAANLFNDFRSFILSSPDMGAHFCRKDRGSTSLMQKYDVLDVFLMGASCGSTTGQLNCDSNFWRACSTKSDLSSRSFKIYW